MQDQTKIGFSVEDDGIHCYSQVGCSNVYKNQLVLSKEAFIEAYNKYFKGESNEKEEKK